MAACGSACRRRTAPKCVRCWHHRPEVGLECRASDDLRRAAWATSPDRARPGHSYERARANCRHRGSERHPLVVDRRAGDRRRPADQAVDRAHHGAGRIDHRAAGARHRARAQPGRGLQLPRGRRRLAALVVLGARGRRVDRAACTGCAGSTLAHAGAAGVRPRADPGRRHRQRHRPRCAWATSSTSCTCTGATRSFPAFNVADAASPSAPRW